MPWSILLVIQQTINGLSLIHISLGDIAPRYSAQIYFRLLGAYRLYKFYGDDIRFKLK